MIFIDDLGRLTEARSGVGTYWPRIEEALTLEGINTPCVRAGVAATVGTEVYGFAPVAELPSDANGGTSGDPKHFSSYDPGPIGIAGGGSFNSPDVTTIACSANGSAWTSRRTPTRPSIR